MNALRISLVIAVFAGPLFAEDKPPVKPTPPTPDQVLEGVRKFIKLAAKADGSFQPGVDRDYEGMSDSAFSDIAPTAYAVIISKTFGWKLPYEENTILFLHSRQREDGSFVNVAGTVDPNSAAGRAYNTTMAIVALKALGEKPKYDPLPVFDSVLTADYKTLPAYMTSFFPLAYRASGREIPAEADKKIRALMEQDANGYLHEHVAATFHAAHYYRLTGRDTPKADAMVKRTLADQMADGSWVRNPLARDRHATFDAVFILKQLGGTEASQSAMDLAAFWSLTCRNKDGGFGHMPGSRSDMDACYFHIGTMVMSGFSKPVDPLPADAQLLGWGHLMGVVKGK
ncbi:MAG TPA: prenyltransferase/squalene oxidase repeat-containing protein [Gemmataceae bacterium]|jgi:geranylgeranyl transferase type-2 subunit beta|nr:prenyltransferase/squalene oxidase repeat-containing protein [Gemmataceae bacterium]